MKINSGMLIFIAKRVFQVTAYSAMILAFCGIKGGVIQVLILFGVGLLYAFFDYYKVIPQEQKFVTENNPEFQRHMEEIKGLFGKNV